MNISGSKTNGNNKLNNLTININSQHIQHDEVGDTWNYTEKNSRIMLILQYKASFTYATLGRCFRFVYIYACNLVSLCFLCCYGFLVNKDLYCTGFKSRRLGDDSRGQT